MEDLLKQSKVRSMPGSEHVAYVGAIAHHLLAFYSLNTIPLAKWNTMNACYCQYGLVTRSVYPTSNVVIGHLFLLVHSLESSEGLQEDIPECRILF